jgi:hypothetical protein
VERRTKPVDLGPVGGILLLPLLLAAGALSIPYALVARRVVARRERRFNNCMKADGRTMEWAQFIREINDGHGTLIVERFSFKGPVRMWWTGENIYEVCPYPLVDWFTMTKDASFDELRDWCRNRYTGATSSALLVDGNEEQWRTVQGNGPFTFQDSVRYVEVPPPRKVA